MDAIYRYYNQNEVRLKTDKTNYEARFGYLFSLCDAMKAKFLKLSLTDSKILSHIQSEKGLAKDRILSKIPEWHLFA